MALSWPPQMRARKAYRLCTVAILAAMETGGSIEVARDAFVAAARDCGCYVRA
jgi:hypothetical protein